MKIIKTVFLTTILFLQYQVTAQPDTNRILVISGGGAKGAWGGGLAEALVNDHGHNYQVVVGASTGSLLTPLVAIEEFEALNNGYTSIKDKDIFNVRPYKTRGKKRGKLKPLQAFHRILIGQKTLGESKNLKKTIRKFYPENYYDQLKGMGKEHIVTVANLTNDVVEYKSTNDYSYDEMVNWMWASANVPVFMSTHVVKKKVGGKKTKTVYVDGGVKEGVPLQKGIERACELDIDNIDVIVHNTYRPQDDTIESGGVLKLLTRTIELFLTESRFNDLSAAKTQEGIIQAMEQDCTAEGKTDFITITYYFMPEEDYAVISNELLFDQREMKELWKRGRNHIGGKENNPELKKHCIQVHIPKEQLCKGDSVIFLDRSLSKSK